jgi:hypothetical protein
MARRTPSTAAAAPPGPVGVVGRRAEGHPDATPTANSAGTGAFGQVRPRVWSVASGPVTDVPVMDVGVES